jgi:hypothetical protein
VWQSAIVSSAKHPDRRRWPTAARHPAWRAGAVAIALILLPWIAVLARPHHHLDVATVTVLVSLSLGLPMIWLTWALYRDARSAKLVSSLSVAQVADQLAVAVSAQWQAEAGMRRLNDPYPLPVAWVLRVTRHECRALLLMNMDRSYEADRNPSAMVTVTLSCSP